VSFNGLVTPVLTGAIGLVKLQLKIPVQQFSYEQVSLGWTDTLANFTSALSGGAPLGFSGQLLSVQIHLQTPGSTATGVQLQKGPYVANSTAPVFADMLSSALTMNAGVYRNTFDVSAQNILGSPLDLIRLPEPVPKGTGAAGLYITTRWRVTG
jgi:hypothetical protein